MATGGPDFEVGWAHNNGRNIGAHVSAIVAAIECCDGAADVAAWMVGSVDGMPSTGHGYLKREYSPAYAGLCLKSFLLKSGIKSVSLLQYVRVV